MFDIKNLIVLVALILTTSLDAMENINISCDLCKYQTIVQEGSTKKTFLTTGTGKLAFFCMKTKQFVSLPSIRNQDIYKKSNSKDLAATELVETKKPVEKGSDYHIFSHPTCLNALIPLDYYRDKNAPLCPVCGKGVLEIKRLSIKD